ncbi:hypothetical protein JCM3765_003952 [Sporobolomyces pararoseus]
MSGSLKSDESLDDKNFDLVESAPTPATPTRIVWYRSTWWSAIALGLCNFAAPGIWGAMNSLGAGGMATPFLVNASNALTFGLMVLTAFLTSTITRYIGVRWTLFFGGSGYAVYAAGLYCNNRFGNEWFLLLGAALCARELFDKLIPLSSSPFEVHDLILLSCLSTGIEAAVAMSYPEPKNQGRFLGWWLSFRVGGQILGGAINLALSADRSTAGKVDPKVYLVFIAIQAAGPFAAFLLPSPDRVQRTDGLPVRLFVDNPILKELKETAKLFFTKRFLLIIPLITQAVFSESFNSTFLTLHFSVRARALGSFLSAVVCIIAGNLFGLLLDSRWSLKKRARYGWILAAVVLQGAWWTWSIIINNEYRKIGPSSVYDWSDSGFGKGFGSYLAIAAGFQLNYMFLYFVCGSLVTKPADLLRIGGLLRATESAAQAVSYGLNSLESFEGVGASALNFALWAVAIVPSWFVIRKIGVVYFGRAERDRLEREALDRGEKFDVHAELWCPLEKIEFYTLIHCLAFLYISTSFAADTFIKMTVSLSARPQYPPFEHVQPTKEDLPFLNLGTIDISRWRAGPEGLKSRQQLAAELEEAVKTQGFFFLENFDFPKEKLDYLQAVSQAILDLPLEEKEEFSAGGLKS